MSFQLYNLRSQSMAKVIERDVADDESFFKGALLIENGAGDFEEVDNGDYAYSGPIDGIALARYGTDGTVPYEGTPSFDITGGFGMNPGRMQAIQLGQGNRELLFSALYVGDLPAGIGGSYGVIRDTDGRWKVNFADTSATVVRLEDLRWTADPINKNRVVVSFLAVDEEVS